MSAIPRLSSHSQGSLLPLTPRPLCEYVSYRTTFRTHLLRYEGAYCCYPTSKMAFGIGGKDHDGRRSSSMDNKVEKAVRRESIDPLNELADPDAGLSAEERAAHVRLLV